MKKWSTTAMIYDGQGDAIRMLLIESGSIKGKYPSRVGFPAGTRSKRDKTFLRTVEREIREETGLRLIAGKEPALTFETVDRGMVKVFFLFSLSDFHGDLRQIEIKDGDTMLSVPYWAGLDEVKATLCRPHQLGLPEALKYFGLMR